MKQEDTNTPDKKRTLEELCQDITLRAERLYLRENKAKYILLVFVVAFVLGALNMHFKWFVMFNWWWAWLLGLMVWVGVTYIINQILINGMKRASSHKQYLRTAKRLKRSIQCTNAISCIISFLPLVHEMTYGIVFFLGLLLVLGFVAGGIDSAFSDDLHELEYRLED